MILGRLGEPARPVDPVSGPPSGPELMRAGLVSHSRQPDVRDCRNALRSSVRRRVPASQGDEPESAGAVTRLARVPRSRPGARAPLLLMREESGASGGKDPGYGNNTVPWEFAGLHPVCRRAPDPERGTRCVNKPNTIRTHGIPSQPSVSRRRGGNGPMRLASIVVHLGWVASPASAPWRGLEAQDTRTLPLDVKRAYMPCITRFFYD
jgi:hypothetical protein